MVRTHAALVSLLTLFTMLAACGDDTADTVLPSPASESSVPAPAAEPPAQAAQPEDPCDLLTEDVVRATFTIPAETAVENHQNPDSPRRLCSYVWEKPNIEEIREQIAAAQAERMQQMVQKMRGGQGAQGILDGVIDIPRTENQVSLNFGPDFESAEAAARGLDQAMETLARGVTRRVQTKNIDREVSFQADVEPVEGVGDAAHFVPRLNQLAILDGQRLLYLSVAIEAEGAANFEHAKRLAAALLD